MQAKDFKVGMKVRGSAKSPWVSAGLLTGEVGVVVGHTPDGSHVDVRHDRNDEAWHCLPKEIELVVSPTIASDLKITPQAKTVLRYLKKRKSLSPMEAQISLGISRLASCIWEIRRRAGYDVHTVMRRDEHGGKYARYSLATVH